MLASRNEHMAVASDATANDDGAARQLQAELDATARQAIHSRRPILHHLNDDSTWLLQIPRPQTRPVEQRSRAYFNILIDPWLAGGQSDVASWFSQQFHATESKVPTIAALEALLQRQEDLAATLGLIRPPDHDPDTSLVDAVAICHEFTDHCHKDTLLTLSPSVPIIATATAAKLIRSWSHFRTVLTTPPFAGAHADWTAASLAPLPDWLAIARLTTPGDALHYHSALLLAFGTAPGPPEALVYAPHGIRAEDLRSVADARPRLETLAFLHGLHDITLSGAQLNLGAHNGLRAQRVVRAKCWVGTHDEVKRGGGVVSWILRRKVLTLRDALEEERRRLGKAEWDGVDDELLDDVNWVVLGNGESRVLE